MSNNQETIADIRNESEAMFRELLEKHVDSLERIHVMQRFNQVFDRIEAAWKREFQKLNDANASMRTCLVNIFTEMLDMSGIEAGRKIKFTPDAIVDEIRSALDVADGGAE